MIDNLVDNMKKKSPKERFLLIIGIVLFLSYLVMGLALIFWKTFPINLPRNYRIALGAVLIVYSVIRFLRVFNDNKE